MARIDKSISLLHCQAHFESAAGETSLTFRLPHGAVRFSLSIPDDRGPQTARLSLPDTYIGVDLAQAVWTAALGKFIGRDGAPLDQHSPYPDLPVSIWHPEWPRKTAVWARCEH